MSDARAEAAAKANLENTRPHLAWDDFTEAGQTSLRFDANIMLEAADQVDAAAGVHRVLIDNDAVEQMARKLASFEGASWIYSESTKDPLNAYGARFKFRQRALALLATLGVNLEDRLAA